VTNRLLSDLEQAITTPATSSGRGTLPCCFLERDLDRVALARIITRSVSKGVFRSPLAFAAY
ncbi:hypothetical protein AK812_SmicGene45063, partial [Symbiodinium microadriaticum]